jgi:hypothetical protein
LSDDPLSVVDNPRDAEATQKDVLDALLRKAIGEIYAEKYYSDYPDEIPPGRQSTSGQPVKAYEILANTVRDIAYCLHQNGTLDTSRLESLLKTSAERYHWIADFDSILEILNSARNLPGLLPSADLPQLSSDCHFAHFNGDIVNSLLAHQMLGTLYQPAGNTWGLPCFTPWYADSAASHPQAVEGYIKTLFHHFAHPYRQSETLSFYIHAPSSMPDPSTCTGVPDFTVEVVDHPTEPSSTRDTIPFALVSANKQPGPGPTATQEERLMAASPALALTSLIAPVIPDSGAVLTSPFPVDSQWALSAPPYSIPSTFKWTTSALITSPFPVHASWEGHNRSARLQVLYEPDLRPRRQYILADALPLDEMDRPDDGALLDLQPQNVLREVRKLYAAFSGAVKYQHDPESECVVEAPSWGCGAFGGDLVVKGMCMMIAAGLTGVRVVLSVTEDRREEARVLRRLMERKPEVSKIWERLTSKNARFCKSYQELLNLNEGEPYTKE